MSREPTTPDQGEPGAPSRPGIRERWGRRPPGVGFWVGSALLAVYLAAALSALFVFRTSPSALPRNLAWVPPYAPLGPSLNHPFGVLPGFGVDLFQALWQATPWDLALVAGILAIDAGMGCLLGAVAGFNEGGLLDGIITFVGDSFAVIPEIRNSRASASSSGNTSWANSPAACRSSCSCVTSSSNVCSTCVSGERLVTFMACPSCLFLFLPGCTVRQYPGPTQL